MSTLLALFPQSCVPLRWSPTSVKRAPQPTVWLPGSAVPVAFRP
jgi:hypothetical protein